MQKSLKMIFFVKKNLFVEKEMLLPYLPSFW